MKSDPLPLTLGVFDSGFGGLTVLRALLPRFPGAHFLYLGDTARLPYGAKSQLTVARYAVEAARFLVQAGAGMLVIACNTATALALPEIRAAVPVPVLGVIEPGAQAARLTASAAPPPHPVLSTETSFLDPVLSTEIPPPYPVLSTEAKRSGETPAFASATPTSPAQPHHKPRILVLATAATVHSHAYRDTCEALGLHATELPCPLLVPLVEEGWIDHPVTREVLRIYLAEALTRVTPDAVVLGCTHYPLIAPAIAATLRELGCHAPVVDSAEATAAAALALHARTAGPAPQITTPGAPPSPAQPAEVGVPPATFTCYATDSIEKFARLGSLFLGQPIHQAHLLDLGG